MLTDSQNGKNNAFNSKARTDYLGSGGGDVGQCDIEDRWRE